MTAQGIAAGGEAQLPARRHLPLEAPPPQVAARFLGVWGTHQGLVEKASRRAVGGHQAGPQSCRLLLPRTHLLVAKVVTHAARQPLDRLRKREALNLLY